MGTQAAEVGKVVYLLVKLSPGQGTHVMSLRHAVVQGLTQCSWVPVSLLVLPVSSLSASPFKHILSACWEWGLLATGSPKLFQKEEKATLPPKAHVADPVKHSHGCCSKHMLTLVRGLEVARQHCGSCHNGSAVRLGLRVNSAPKEGPGLILREVTGWTNHRGPCRKAASLGPGKLISSWGDRLKVVTFRHWIPKWTLYSLSLQC